MANTFFNPSIGQSKHESFQLYLAGTLAILVVWSALTFSGAIGEFFLSNPVITFGELIKLFTEKGIVNDILITVSRAFIGFSAAALIGVPIGVFLGTFRRIEAFVEPMINLFRYVPSAAIIPLAILWFGIGETQKYFIVFFGTFPFIVLYTTYAVATIEKKLFHVAYSLGVKTKSLLSRVIFPKALPEIYEILRIELGGAWGLVIMAEIVAATTGLGHKLILSQRFLQTPVLFAEIIIILLIGLVTDQTLKIGYKKFFPWAEKNKGT